MILAYTEGSTNDWKLSLLNILVFSYVYERERERKRERERVSNITLIILEILSNFILMFWLRKNQVFQTIMKSKFHNTYKKVQLYHYNIFIFYN